MFVTSKIGTPVNFNGYILPANGTTELEQADFKALSAHQSYQDMKANGYIEESNKAPKGVTPFVMGDMPDDAAAAQAQAANSGNQGLVDNSALDNK